MKKRHKALMVIGVGALVYGIGLMTGVSFLNSFKGQDAQQQNIAASKAMHIQTETTQELAKRLVEIHPAAGASQE
jgi:flagellar basal body-associated protein FliL